MSLFKHLKEKISAGHQNSRLARSTGTRATSTTNEPQALADSPGTSGPPFENRYEKDRTNLNPPVCDDSDGALLSLGSGSTAQIFGGSFMQDHSTQSIQNHFYFPHFPGHEGETVTGTAPSMLSAPQMVSKPLGTEESSENTLHANAGVQQDAGQDPSKGVQLPFKFFSSISRNWDFYGQEDVLDEIDFAFGLKRRSGTFEEQVHDHDDHSCIPKSYVLSGLGGIGKTSIAIQYLYSRLSQFDAIFWIYADTTRKLATQFVTLAKELVKQTAQDSDGMDEKSACELVRAWLAAPTGYRTKNGPLEKVVATWLMVFDNADDPDVLYDWLPKQGPGCILVTGRYPYLMEKNYLLKNGLDLQPLSPEIGGEMLRRLSDREQEANAVQTSTRIVELLGGLPLAISQMSAIIKRKHLTLRDFEDWYREDSKALHNLECKRMQGNYQYTVMTAWAVDQLSASTRSLLQVLSVLDPDRIPDELLHVDGGKEVKLPNYPIKKNEYFNARAELINTAFVKANMFAGELCIHRLVQDVVRQRMEERELQAIYAAAALLIDAVWPYVSGTDPTRNQLWRIPKAEKYTSHVCRLHDLFGSEIREGKYLGTTTSGYVFCSYAWYMIERGRPDQTEIFASLAQRILRNALDAGDDDEQVVHWLGEAHHNLSLAAVGTKSSDGMQDVKIWLDLLLDRSRFTSPSKEKASSLATAYNQMGFCHIKNDEVEDAMNCWKKSLATYRSVESPPNFSGTWPSISLAILYTLQGRPNKGEEVLRPTLDEHERILGKDDTTTTESGHIWRTMGNIRNAQERYEEALEYHERAVRNMKVTLGEMHDFTGDCFYSLGVDWMRQGDTEKARENLDAAIKAFTCATHREAQAARAMWRMGCLLKTAGDRLESDMLFQKAMKIRHELKPDDDRPVEELHDKDWTDLVYFWSR